MGLEIALFLGFEGLLATIGGGLINLAAGLALSFGAQKLVGKTGASSTAATGAQASLAVAADYPRTAIVGETCVAGSLAYWHLSGPDNDTLCMVIALADHECNALTGLLVDGVYHAVDPGNGQVEGFGDKLRVNFHSGAIGQAADADVVAGSGGHWTANEKGTGVCYAAVFAKYDATLFPSGIPRMHFVVQGAKLYDPRTGVTAYTDNWGVAVYNVMRGIRQGASAIPVVGLNSTADSVRLTDTIYAANASDELVVRTSGPPEKRYRVGVALASTGQTQSHLETLLAAAAGEIVESAGVYRIFAGVARSPVATITDGDLLTNKPFAYSAKHTRAQLVNTIEGSFLDATKAFVLTPLPTRSSPADRALDGGIRLSQSLDLSACPSKTQAQRVMEIARRRARQQGAASYTVRAGLCGLEAGDWITSNSDRRGWSGRAFEITAVQRANDLTAALTLVEVDDAIDDWTIADEIADGVAASLPSAGPTLSLVTGLVLSLFTQASEGGAQRPGLRLVYDPITDGTVVSLRVQYRRVGDDVTLEINIPDPQAGSFRWLNGIVGGALYEARVQPVTLPERAVSWTAWTATVAETAPQVIDVAATVLYIDPALIPPAELSAQEKFELSLTTAIADVQGSIANVLRESLNAAQRAGDAAISGELQARVAQTQVRTLEQVTTNANMALASQITTIAAQLGDSGAAALEIERQARVAADSAAALARDTLTANIAMVAAAILTENEARVAAGVATASQITTLFATTGAQSSSITQLLTANTATGPKWSISLSVNGYATGFVTLDGMGNQTTFGVLANKFFVAQPGVAGGDPVPVFTIGTIAGVPSIGLTGNVQLDGQIQARHIAANSITTDKIAASVITARRLQSDDGFSFLDFTPGNKRLRFASA